MKTLSIIGLVIAGLSLMCMSAGPIFWGGVSAMYLVAISIVALVKNKK